MYDIICIGAGSGGLNMASFFNRIGLKVLLIDKSDASIGGDCLNYGCVPSKALIHISRTVHSAKQASGYGIKAMGKVNIKKVMDDIRAKQNIIREHENADYFSKKGMDVVLGFARFVDKTSVVVNGKVYKGKKIIIATGSRPRQLDIKGADKADIITNETIFNLKKLPDKLVVIGGGPIGIELGQAFNRLGSKVTVVQNQSTFLPKETPEIAQVLQKRLEGEGIEFLFDAKTESFRSPHELVVSVKGKKKYLSFDKALVSIGRVLNIDGLDVHKAGIEMDETGRKLVVDEYLRTTNKNVFVCGDVAGSYQFTHAAELHAGVLLRNFFSPLKKKLSNDHLSWVTFTDPEIASFGLQEKTLQERGITYEKWVTDFADDDRAITDEIRDGKLIYYVSKDKLLGGVMIGNNAGEMIQELILANSAGIPLKSLFAKIYPYPTGSRINKSLIGQHYASKLTGRNKAILRTLFSFFG